MRQASAAVPDATPLPRAGRHLHVVGGQPRPAGSAAEADARAWCRGVLERHGFSVTEEPFTYSAAVGRWMVPVVCALVAAALAGTAVHWRGGGAMGPASLSLGVLALAVALVSRWAARTGVLSLPLARRTGTNLVGVRGAPTVWLVAHLDTKSQPMPTLVRAALLVALGGALAATVLVGVAWPAGREAPWVIPLVGTLAGVVLSFATVGEDSPGARDNGTGVAAVLATIEQLPSTVSLGVVFPSAEELGLAGMRAWVRGRDPGTAINVDTVDDDGALRCMVHGAQSRPLGAAVARAGTIRVSGIIPGLLTDGVALADAGWPAVTVSGGTWRTLARIHRPVDTVGGLTGRGADEVARLLSTLLTTRP
ncbi:MAG: M28 family peptidase [Gemmatimonadetes bacterium]|nr:M28 family peptidase [Gemmatimonadota bacterium]